jgi:hypothetical protein
MITCIAEKYNLLPKNQFGGQPGCATTDVLHLITTKVFDSWAKRKTVGLLFLDIEGALPNATHDRLIHNLRKQRVPTKLVQYVKAMLTGCHTKLHFDNYESKDFM